MFVSRFGRRHCLLILVFSISLSFAHSQNLIISEFLAINNSVLADEDGDFPDWIEIYNADTLTVNLNGWFLTDNPLNIDKWQFPNILLDSGEYLMVFASEKNRKLISGNLHTNFKLSGSGEFLALLNPDSVISSSFGDAFPSQQADVSYGLYNGQYVFMTNPTPGAANDIGDYILQPDFSHERGFYTSPFDIVLSSLNGNCDIYFTTNGNRPTAVNGIKYTSPVTIDKTTVLSAVAIDTTSLAVSNIVTQSYLFVDSIMVQPNDPAGYPTEWGNEYPADYEMDPEICAPRSKTAIEEALKSLPTVSLVTDIDHLFLDTNNAEIGGLYMNTTLQTVEWERPVSMEYFDSSQNKSFQVNCGLRIHGGNSRKPGNSPKHGFRVSFRSDYGPSKLNFKMFEEESAANEFNSLVLRAGYNYSWIKNAPAQCKGADYIRDPFAKKTQLDMDRTAAHTKFVFFSQMGL
jgi:hypothetical protein